MKFPFVTRARHEAEIAEEKHATDYTEQRRDYWRTLYSAVAGKHIRLEKEILGLQENLRGVIAQRDMASKNYQRIMEDYHDALGKITELEADAKMQLECRHEDYKMLLAARAKIHELNDRLAPFLRKRGPNGKFVKQPKGETP